MSLSIALTIDVDTGCEPYTITLVSESISGRAGSMWVEAGVYEALYDCDGKPAGQITDVLLAGLMDMVAKPDKYEALDPPDAEGLHNVAFAFLWSVAYGCQKYPKAIIRVYR
jgi:hypothetical protein